MATLVIATNNAGKAREYRDGKDACGLSTLCD